MLGGVKKTFCFQKFVDNTQQCFAFTTQLNFAANNLDFHWRWRWWNQIQATFLNLFYFTNNKITTYLPLPASSSIKPTFSLEFSSLYEFSCLFHSSTFAVDSWRAEVNRALLFFSVVSSTSHFFAFAELQRKSVN